MASSSSSSLTLSVLLFLACLSAGCCTARGEERNGTLHLRLFAVNPATAQTTVTGLNTTNHNVSDFGDISILNGVLYERGEPNLPAVATLQGLSVGVSSTDFTVLTTLNLVFTAGQYNGSSLLIIGAAETQARGYADRSIVGGSGVFRLARGYEHNEITELSPDIVVQFDFYVVPDKEFYYY